MGKLARITWPQEYSELKRIEELLLCGICYDYMDTSVMTPCSHNYCSLCIRKYLHYKTQCPACLEKTFEKDLHTNRILDELITYFSKIREKLVDCIVGARIDANQDDEIIQDSPRVTPVRPARTNQSLKKTPRKMEMEKTQMLPDNTLKTGKIASLNHEPQKILSSPSTSGTSKVATIFTPKSKKKLVNTTSEKTVPCPVCGVEVSEVNINKHLDDCLKRETEPQRPKRIEPRRKPLPKLVFSLMKDTEMRKKMKELGLSSLGDRKTLEARFQRYSTLYNAECDKLEPRPIEELLRQCETEENLEKKMLKFAQAANRLKVTRNSEQNVIEDAQKKYLDTNRQNYQNLIATMNDRDKSRKMGVRRSLIGQDNAVCAADSSINHRDEDNVNHINEVDNDLASYSMNAYEATFQDSDSNSSCPLQHYASDDPMKFLSFKMSISDTSMTPPKTPSKLNTSEAERSDENLLLDTPVTPIKNITLKDIKSDLPAEECLTVENDDIYNATTENESSDEDLILPSPKATIRHTTKRLKLSLRQTLNNDNPSKIKSNDLTGDNLALSIVRDFTFDTSSNDSVESEATNGIMDKEMSVQPNVKSHKTENISTDILKLDKENDESTSKTKITSERVVDRPVRKRNCVIRSENVVVTDSAILKEKSIMAPDESTRGDAQENEKVASPSRIDSPLKRRRRRKIVTPDENETLNPPRRPLRKRHVNSVSTDKSQK